MVKLWGSLILTVFELLMSGCMDQEGVPEAQKQVKYNIVLSDDLYIDSALVFFFRNLSNTDTLIWREVIYDISPTPSRFNFDLPAGYYAVAFWGNISMDRVVERPPFSRDSVWFSYQGGIEPPEIFHGINYFNVGEDTTKLSGMLLLISRVELTLKNIPSGIERLEARILNTSSGIGFYGYLKEEMTPPLSMNLESPTPDSTYLLTMNCFPSALSDDKSTIEVNGYDAAGKLIYSGSSQPFFLKYGVRMILTCSFDTVAVASKSTVSGYPGSENVILEWNYDEKNM